MQQIINKYKQIYQIYNVLEIGKPKLIPYIQQIVPVLNVPSTQYNSTIFSHIYTQNNFSAEKIEKYFLTHLAN